MTSTAGAFEDGIDHWDGVVGGFVARCERPVGGRLGDSDRYRAALSQMGLADGPIVEAQQVHGAGVTVVDRYLVGDAPEPVTRIEGVDGLVTDLPDLALAIYVADCLAIFMYHRARPAIGIAHAGWRGLADDMPGQLVRAALSAYGGVPEDLQFALSPCIEACCFEVGEEVAAVFEETAGAVIRDGERPHVDLRVVARARLHAAGVRDAQITEMAGCTRCEPERFSSYRWDPERCGRNVALVALSAGQTPSSAMSM